MYVFVRRGGITYSKLFQVRQHQAREEVKDESFSKRVMERVGMMQLWRFYYGLKDSLCSTASIT